jgi:hypothetical protein
VTDKNPTIVVTSEESLPDVVARLREAAQGGQVVDLVVPIDSALLLTAREFRTLKEAIDGERIAVLLRTSDPLRLQLAERLGLRTKPLPRPRVVAAPAVPAPARVVSVPAPAPVTGEEWPGETAAAEPVPRTEPESHWPSLNGSTVLSDETSTEEESMIPEPGLANPPRRWLPVAAALAVLVVAAVLAIRYVVPQATIRIVPRTAAVASSLVFDVTADGQPTDDAAAFALATQPQQIEVVWKGTAPVTGVRIEPDGTASSAIELRNPGAEPLTVDAGTTITTETGVEFAFAAAVTVPAADAATGAPGAATGNVQAVQPGSGGNVGTGELGGRLENGVYYSNRMGPAAGGTDKEFPVVDQADLDGLIAAAREAAPALATEAVAAEQPGAKILPSSVEIAEQVDTFDHEVGAEVEEVSLSATLTIDVLTYDGAAASEQYESSLAAQLADDAPDGFAVDAEDIAFAEPALLEERDGGARLEVTASAEAEAVLDEEERAALAAELAGASPEEAAAVLGRSQEIAEFSVTYHPAWLAPRMPNNARRIQFEVAE